MNEAAGDAHSGDGNVSDAECFPSIAPGQSPTGIRLVSLSGRHRQLKRLCSSLHKLSAALKRYTSSICTCSREGSRRRPSSTNQISHMGVHQARSSISNGNTSTRKPYLPFLAHPSSAIGLRPRSPGLLVESTNPVFRRVLAGKDEQKKASHHILEHSASAILLLPLSSISQDHTISTVNQDTVTHNSVKTLAILHAGNTEVDSDKRINLAPDAKLVPGSCLLSSEKVIDQSESHFRNPNAGCNTIHCPVPLSARPSPIHRWSLVEVEEPTLENPSDIHERRAPAGSAINGHHIQPIRRSNGSIVRCLEAPLYEFSRWIFSEFTLPVNVINDSRFPGNFIRFQDYDREYRFENVSWTPEGIQRVWSMKLASGTLNPVKSFGRFLSNMHAGPESVSTGALGYHILKYRDPESPVGHHELQILDEYFGQELLHRKILWSQLESEYKLLLAWIYEVSRGAWKGTFAQFIMAVMRASVFEMRIAAQNYKLHSEFSDLEIATLKSRYLYFNTEQEHYYQRWTLKHQGTGGFSSWAATGATTICANQEQLEDDCQGFKWIRDNGYMMARDRFEANYAEDRDEMCAASRVVIISKQAETWMRLLRNQATLAQAETTRSGHSMKRQ